MDSLAAAIEATQLASYLKVSRWGYASVNAIHILGIALLIGAIIPLDLRLLGFWQRLRLDDLARVLVPVAACGLLIAIVAGALLFSAGASDYLSLKLFLFKMVLVATGMVSAILAHVRFGLWLQRAPPPKLVAVISVVCWLGALAAGRMIAFVSG